MNLSENTNIKTFWTNTNKYPRRERANRANDILQTIELRIEKLKFKNKNLGNKT